jgi:hypothetical protein
VCVVAVDFVASSCTSQIYKRTATSLSVRSVAVFQKQILKKGKNKKNREERVRVRLKIGQVLVQE